jgi:ABC-type uncharacterized transport system substrate-binding protein
MTADGRMRLIGLAVGLAVGLALASLAAEAQQAGKVARIGYMSPNLADWPHTHEAFRQGLRDLGYVEGRNLVVEYRDAEGKLERLPALAAELVALKADVIVAPNTVAALAAKQVSRTIPIVFAAAADPVASGLVTSLARPGGNVTGLSILSRSSLASVWSCSSRPFLGSGGSLSSGRRSLSTRVRQPVLEFSE